VDQSGGGKPRVLVVDDAADLVELLRELLTEEGYEVIGRQSLPSVDEILALSPDVAILDLVVDGRFTGLELVMTLRDEPRAAALPVIVCSGGARWMERTGVDLEALGVPLLPKPFDLDVLLSMVEAAAKRNPGAR
jgi:DNA-binding response OmpR family regulator